MFEGARTIATIRGIDIRVHVTWLFIAALVTWSFWSRFTVLRDFEALPALAMAVAAAVLFFASILAHELAHALEAIHRGVRVSGITLFLFGGATESKLDARRPRDELALTAVGPLSSFVLAAAFGGASVGADAADLASAAAVLGAVGWINLALGVFNLLPGAPLDGGRILRAVVWAATGDRHRALRIAAIAGQVLGLVLIALGITQLLFVPGGGVGGIWIAFIGWFLRQAATAELTHAEATRLLHDLPVRQILSHHPGTVGADEPVAAAVETFFRHHDADHVAVTDGGGGIVGVLTIDQVRGLDRESRDRVAVREVMSRPDDLPSVDVDERATRLLDVLDPGATAMVATENGRPVGLISPEQVATALRRRADLDDDRSREAA